MSRMELLWPQRADHSGVWRLAARRRRQLSCDISDRQRADLTAMGSARSLCSIGPVTIDSNDFWAALQAGDVVVELPDVELGRLTRGHFRRQGREEPTAFAPNDQPHVSRLARRRGGRRPGLGSRLAPRPWP